MLVVHLASAQVRAHAPRNGTLDANVANSAFKDVQIAVMHFDYAYEAVPKKRNACRELAFQFGMDVGSYIEEVMATSMRPPKGIQGAMGR